MQRIVLIAILLAAISGFSGKAYAQEEMIDITFQDIELHVFLDWVAQKLEPQEIRFLYKSEIQQVRINLLSNAPIPKRHLLDVVRVILQFNGFLLIEVGTGEEWKIYRVIRDNMGRWEPAKFYQDAESLGQVEGYEFVTVVVPLKYADAKEVQGALKLARVNHPNVGNIVGIQSSNTLLVSDYAPMVKMLLKVVDMMDKPADSLTYRTFDLIYSDPETMKTKLSELLAATKQQGGQPSSSGGGEAAVNMVAFPRTQKLLVQSTPERLDEIASIIREIDIPTKGDPARIHYVPLKHAKAKEVAKVLTELAEPLQATIRAQQRMGALSVERGPGGATVRAVAGQSTDEEDNLKPTIVADENTNSLIVAADKAVWDELENIIHNLDRLLPQVLIEVAIVELSPEDVLNIGVEMGTMDDPAEDSTRAFAGTAFGLTQLVDQNGAPITAQNPGIPVGRLPVPTQGFDLGLTRDNIFQIPIILKMLKTERDLRVLSMPRILTNDNQQAKLEVTQAFPVTQFQTTTGIVQQSFDDFEEAGTELKITPHISSANYLRLDIEQKLEIFTAAQTNPNIPPPKTSRELTTSITIPNHQTVVIGGLRAHAYRETVNKVPFLGDIPLVGFFFRNTERTVSLNHIYIFCTPHILKESDFKDLYKLSYDSKVELEGLGGDLQQVDPDFLRYRKEQEQHRERGRLESLYMLDYRSPTEKK